MAITPLPPAPSRAVPSTFSTLADAFLAALSTFVTEANALETNVNAKEVIVTAQASAAATAMASANFKGLWSALSGALAVPASVSHLGRYWMLLSNLANVAAKTPGTDSEWQEIGNVTIQDFQAAVNPKAMSQGVAMTAAESGSRGIQVADNDNIDFGTGNFTLVWKGSLPDWTPSVAYTSLLTKFISTSGYAFSIRPTGNLYVQLNFGGGVANSSTVPNFVDGTIHEIVAVITVGLTNTTVDFYADGLALGAQQTFANSGTVSTAANLQVSGISDTRYASTVHHAYTFNRALTAAEVLDLYRNGIAFADKYGSQTPIYTSDFSSGVDKAIGIDVTLNGNIDSIGGENDNLRGYATNVSGPHRIILRDSDYSTGRWVGKKGFLYSLYYYIPSVNTNVKGIKIGSNPTIHKTYDTWTLVSGTYNDNVTYYCDIYMTDATDSISFVGANNVSDDLVYFRVFTASPIGATLCLLPENAQPSPGQWIDASTNLLHAMQPATGSSLTRPKDTFTVKWTNTWAGTHEVQYIGGVNQNVLPPNCYVQSIIGVITGTTIEDIIIGDGSDTDHWVAITTGLAEGTVNFTVANAISDGTNYKLLVDPDANFTGSITWTIRGYIYQ